MSPYQPISAYPALSYGAAPAPMAEGFALADLFAIVAARRALILWVTAVTVLLAVIVVLAMPTVYSSSAVVMLDQRKNNVTDVSAVLSQLPADSTTLQNQVQILTSRELADRAIAKLGLDNDPEFNPLLGTPGLAQIGSEMLAELDPRTWFDDSAASDSQTMHDRVVENFLKHVSADANGLSTAISINVTSRDPAKAARIANTIAALYLADQVDVKRDAADTTDTWLNQRLHDLSQQLQLQEGAVATYKAKHGLTDTAPGTSLVDQQLVGINTQIVAARSDLAEKQATADRIQSLIQSGNAADVGQVVSSPAILALRTQAAELQQKESDLSGKYGPLHPALQTVEAQKRDLDTEIAQEVQRIAGAANSDVNVAQAHLQSLLSSLGGANRQFTGENYSRVELEALQANADATRAQYEAFVTRLRQSQDMDSVQTPESRIISPAAVPLRPSGPKRMLIVAASLPLGLLLGLLAALSVEKLAPLWPVQVNGSPRATLMPPPVFRTAPPPRAAKPRPAPPRPQPVPLAAPVWRGPPILAEVADKASLKAGDYVLDYPKSAYAHSIAALAKQLESHEGAAIVVVTSAEPGDNKSAIGVSLTRAASLMGKKAVLVDCDPAQTATGTMHIASQAGLYDVLTGGVPLHEAFTKDPRTEAFVLAMTRQPPNLPTMFGSQQMKKLIDILRTGCDMVVIDCARAGAGPEAALLARLADATLLVSRQNTLYAPAVQRSIELLNSANAAPIGIVVTR